MEPPRVKAIGIKFTTGRGFEREVTDALEIFCLTLPTLINEAIVFTRAFLYAQERAHRHLEEALNWREWHPITGQLWLVEVQHTLWVGAGVFRALCQIGLAFDLESPADALKRTLDLYLRYLYLSEEGREIVTFLLGEQFVTMGVMLTSQDPQ